MIRALVITTTPDRPERALLEGIKKHGVELTVLCDDPAHLPFLPSTQVEALKISSRFDLRAALRIRKIVRTRGITLIHSFSARALTVALLATMGLPTKHIAYRGTMGHLDRLDPLSWLSFLNPRVTKISCVSNAVRDFLLSLGVSHDRAITIYKGHDLAWYNETPSATRASLGIPSTAILGAFLGNMRRVKGADLLLQALDLLPENSNVHLLVIGEVRDPAVEAALAQMKHREWVHFLGFRKDGATLLKLCDFNVMPSREREGFPKAVVEGMAQGIPAIVSRVGGMPELVESGVSGLVVEPNDAGVLADAISQMASDRSKLSEFSTAARNRIRDHFTIQKTIEETVALYKSTQTNIT